MTSPLDVDDERIRAGLLAYWNFDDYYEFCKNDIHWLGVEDLSGNGHHGALLGDAELSCREAELISLQNFSLTYPIDGQIVYTTCPMLMWESATAAEIHSPHSIHYEIFVDKNAGFENPTILMTRGKTTTVQVCDLAPDRFYYWKVKATNSAGASQWCAQVHSFVISDDATAVGHGQAPPASSILLQNYPNPCNSTTVIRFQLVEEGDVTIAIYNLSGQVVNSLLSEYKSGGAHVVVWDATDETGDKLGSGLYLCRLKFRDHRGNVQTSDRKMIVLD
ncbi:T9SS type A sorting domain-containing protein [candidate division KSB1 bacterium]|nr:T9SS type A sorting domain-containing protein [candidate division KSB1 bacterium]